MGFKLEELIRELDNQKRKYHEKLLSVDGEWSLVLRTMDVFDIALDLSALLIPEFYFSSMAGSLLFGLDLFDLEPLSLEFSWRYPTLDEWLNGVSIVFSRAAPGYATPVEQFISTGVKEEHRQDIERSMLSKGVYGRSRYGQSYYDPAAVRKLLEQMLLVFFKKHAPHTSRRTAIEATAKALGINPELARYMHDIASMTMASHVGCFILDYGLLDVSYLCEEYEADPRMGKVRYIDYDGSEREAEIMTLADMMFGCILDVSALDYCYLMPDEDVFHHSENPYIDAVDQKLHNFRDRFMLTPLGFSNYVRGDEAEDYHKCERTNVWGELMALRYTVEHVVESFLAREVPDLDPFSRRKYISAALQLVGHTGKRHRWGYGVFKYMALEELREWWLDYWSKQGLDLKALEKIFSLVEPWLQHIVRIKVEMGRRLRLQRLGIPLE